MPNAQIITCLVCVAASAGYLLIRAKRVFDGRRDLGCHGCNEGCGNNSEPVCGETTPDGFVPDHEVDIINR